MAWSCHYATGCFVAFLGDIFSLKSGKNIKKLETYFALFIFLDFRIVCVVYPYGKQCCLSALELFHCLPPLFLLSTPVENSEAIWKKATKCNKKTSRSDLKEQWFFFKKLKITHVNQPASSDFCNQCNDGKYPFRYKIFGKVRI